jgi:hypothetical protein
LTRWLSLKSIILFIYFLKNKLQLNNSFRIIIRKVFIAHIHKRMFEQIIDCSNVGIDPEIEDEIDDINAYGLQIGEEEDENEYFLKFDYSKIANELFKTANSETCFSRNRKTIYDLVKK